MKTAKEAEKLTLLDYLESHVHIIKECSDERPETVTGDQTVVDSISHGEIEVWNFICCNRQNWEYEKKITDNPNPASFVTHMEFAICDESEEVQAFFKAKGFDF
jgi:hypothetical protein